MTSTILAGTLLAAHWHFGISPYYAAGAFSGIVLTPDLDVDNGCISHHIIRSIPVVGWLAEKLWRLYWLPYARILPHRSPLSHVPIIGTLGRVALPIAALCAIGHAPPYNLLTRWLIGLAASDTLHAVMDSVVTAFRRRF